MSISTVKNTSKVISTIPNNTPPLSGRSATQTEALLRGLAEAVLGALSARSSTIKLSISSGSQVVTNALDRTQIIVGGFIGIGETLCRVFQENKWREIPLETYKKVYFISSKAILFHELEVSSGEKTMIRKSCEDLRFGIEKALPYIAIQSFSALGKPEDLSSMNFRVLEEELRNISSETASARTAMLCEFFHFLSVGFFRQLQAKQIFFKEKKEEGLFGIDWERLSLMVPEEIALCVRLEKADKRGCLVPEIEAILKDEQYLNSSTKELLVTWKLYAVFSALCRAKDVFYRELSHSLVQKDEEARLIKSLEQSKSTKEKQSKMSEYILKKSFFSEPEIHTMIQTVLDPRNRGSLSCETLGKSDEETRAKESGLQKTFYQICSSLSEKIHTRVSSELLPLYMTGVDLYQRGVSL